MNDEPTAGHWDCSAEEYHGNHERIGNSMKELYREHPARYNALYVEQSLEREAPSDAMKFGTLVHLSLLEPELYAKDVAIGPDTKRDSKAWKAFAKENEGRILVKKQEHALVVAATEAAFAHPVARALLEADGPTEDTIWWKHKTGLVLKSRRDKVVENLGGRRVVVDLKTSRDIDPESFARSIHNFGYHRQAPWYLAGDAAILGTPASETTVWAWIVLPNSLSEMPFRARVYEPSAPMLKLGHAQNEDALERMASAYEGGDWTSAPDRESVELELPAWAYRSDYEVA